MADNPNKKFTVIGILALIISGLIAVYFFIYNPRKRKIAYQYALMDQHLDEEEKNIKKLAPNDPFVIELRNYAMKNGVTFRQGLARKLAYEIQNNGHIVIMRSTGVSHKLDADIVLLWSNDRDGNGNYGYKGENQNINRGNL